MHKDMCLGTVRKGIASGLTSILEKARQYCKTRLTGQVTRKPYSHKMNHLKEQPTVLSIPMQKQ